MNWYKKLPRSTRMGCGLLLCMWVVAVLGPPLMTYDPIAIALESGQQPPGIQHWLGTDYAGRDIFTRLIYSIHLAYVGGLGSLMITVGFGSIPGLLAGYHRGLIDAVIIRIIDLWLIIPELLTLIVLIALLGQGVWQIIVATGIVGIASYARFVRSLTIVERNQPYIEAAHALGTPHWRIVRYHILPNISPTLATYLATRFGNVILSLSSLSFLGIGVPVPTPELGKLLNEGLEVIRYAWWVVLGPILVLWITVLSTNLISDGMAEGSA